MKTKITLISASLFSVMIYAQPGISLGTSGNTIGCAPHVVEFFISNFAGNSSATTYILDFGDGTPVLNYTQATLPISISHTYLEASCGVEFNGNQNTFAANITATDVTGSATATVTPIRISKKPNAAFNLSAPVICSGGSIIFTNSSNPGVTYSNNGVTCNTNPPFYWELIGPSAGTVISGSFGANNGFPTNINAWTPGTSPLTMEFTGPGSYQMKLSIGNSCGIDDTTIQFSVIESSPSVNLGVNGNLTSCAPTSFSFSISNTDNNHESTVYTVTFSDGSPSQTFNHPPPAFVSHTFTQSSCGQTSLNNLPDAFWVQITAQNPCANAVATIEPIRISTPPVAQFTALPDPVCINSTVSINSTADPGTNVSFTGCNTNHGMVWSISPATGWTLSSGTLGSVNGQPTNYTAWTSGSSQLQLSFSQPGNYTITQRIRNSCGEDVATEVVCVVPPLTANFTLSGSPCATSVLSTDNLTTPVNTCVPPVYVWSILPGAPFNVNVPPFTVNSFEPKWLLTQEGLYTVTLSATNACGTSTSTNTFTIVAPPDVNLAAVPPGCAPYTVDPSATYDDGGGTIISQQWQINGGAWQTITPAEPVDFPPQVFTAGTHTIKVRIVNECGIDSSSVVFNVSESNNQINVNAGPDANVCNTPNPYILTGFSPAGGTWSGPGVTTSGVFMPSGVGIVTLTYTVTQNGCTATDQVVLSVSNPTIANAGLDQNICAGSAVVQLNGTPVGGIWSGTGVTWAGVFTPSTVGSFSLTYSVGSGNCQVSDNLVITVFPLPSVTVADATICAGESTTLTATGSGALTPYTYAWSPSTGLSATTGASVTANPSATQTYVVTITSANTCTSTDQATVTVTPLPVVDAGINQNICLDLQGSLVFEGTPAGGIWSGNPFITASGLFTPAESGVFPCIYTAGDVTCSQSDTINVLVAVCTGLSPTLHNESTFTLFYNPYNESLMLLGFTEAQDNLLLEIIDISGKVLSTYALMPSNEKIQSVSIGNLSGGIYIARVLNGANLNALKFVVSN